MGLLNFQSTKFLQILLNSCLNKFVRIIFLVAIHGLNYESSFSQNNLLEGLGEISTGIAKKIKKSGNNKLIIVNTGQIRGIDQYFLDEISNSLINHGINVLDEFSVFSKN